MSGKSIRILQGILDRHMSRKNPFTYGKGDPCLCEDCAAISKVLEKEKTKDI